MKKFLIAILLLSSLPAFSFAQSRKLPDACRKILDQNFRGWKFKKVSGEIKIFLRKTDSKNADGNIISGDWNGDAKRDFAVLIDHGSETLNDGTKLTRNVSIAFVRDGKNFKHFVLGTFGDYLAFEKKGTKVYDYESQSSVKFINDAIAVGLWEKSSTSYVWRKNKFIYFITSD